MTAATTDVNSPTGTHVDITPVAAQPSKRRRLLTGAIVSAQTAMTPLGATIDGHANSEIDDMVQAEMDKYELICRQTLAKVMPFSFSEESDC